MQPDPGVRLRSTAANSKREGENKKGKEEQIAGRKDVSPLPSLSVSHRGGERQATMGPFSGWLKVVI